MLKFPAWMKELKLQIKHDRRFHPTICFDIESRPAPDSVMERFYYEDQSKLPEPPGKFDPKDVKLGTRTKPETIANYIAEKAREHSQRIANYQRDLADAKQEAWNQFTSVAALSGMLGQVAAIGYGLVGESSMLVGIDATPDDEKAMLVNFWELINVIEHRGTLISHNGHRFDIPFLTWRSWAHKDCKPKYLYNLRYRRFDEFSTDLLEIARMGMYNVRGPGLSLNNLAKMMGVPGKMEGMDGSQFWKTYQSDKVKALEYLEDDIMALYHVGKRMGVIS